MKYSVVYYKLTCDEFRIVKIQANASELLLATNSNPNIHVPPSNGNSANTLIRIRLCKDVYYKLTTACTLIKIRFTVLTQV